MAVNTKDFILNNEEELARKNREADGNASGTVVPPVATVAPPVSADVDKVAIQREKAAEANANAQPMTAGVQTDGTTPGAVATPTATQTTQQKRPSYAEMYQIVNPFKPLSDKDKEALRKKERRDKMFAAIGDGISALSNLYFTTKGAPNAYDPRHNMSEKVRARYDKITKDFEQRSQAYTHGLLQAQKMDDDANYRDFLMRLREEDNERKNKAQEAKDEYNAKRIEGLIEKNEGEKLKNEKARLQIELMQETNPLRVQLLHKQMDRIDWGIKQTQTNIHNSNLRTHKYISGGGSNGVSVVYTKDEDGNDVVYQVPKGFVSGNRGALMKAAGVESTETVGTGRRAKAVKKSVNQIDKEIMDGWNEACTKVLLTGGGRQASGGSSALSGGTKSKPKYNYSSKPVSNGGGAKSKPKYDYSTGKVGK